MLPRSLSARLTLFMTVWTVIALLTTGFGIITFFKYQAEEDFQQLLLAHTYNLIGAVDMSADNELRGKPDLGDPNFLRPGSGWYWAIARADEPTSPLLSSQSIGGGAMTLLPTAQIPFDDTFRRAYVFEDGNGDRVQRLESQLYIGEGATLYQIVMSGNQSDLDETVSEFSRTVAIFLGVFGVLTLAAMYWLVRTGLRPLRQATDALEDVRMGRSTELTGRFPTEIEPFVSSTNRLIRSNFKIVERSRSQVGNLAHALKTPLTVILNETRQSRAAMAASVRRQAETMQESIQAYLARARVSAQRETITAVTQIDEAEDRLLRVMQKLSPELTFDRISAKETVVFRGERQDYEEMLGNLLENASRFAKSTVRLVTSLDTTRDHPLHVTVEDDGPGIPAEDLDRAKERGARLDETKPGSGLGLAIVRDIAEDYGGTLILAKSELGGLKAIVMLPGDRQYAATSSGA